MEQVGERLAGTTEADSREGAGGSGEGIETGKKGLDLRVADERG